MRLFPSIWLLAAALLTFGPNASYAHEGDDHHKHDSMRREHKTERMDKRGDEMAKRLSLTEVQRKAVHELNKQRAEAFHLARHNSSLNAAQRQAQFDEVDSLYRIKLKSILTPQQYEQWQAEYNSAVMPRGKNARHDKRYKHSADACCKGQCTTKERGKRPMNKK